jgi:hypothetical protein
MLKASRSSGFDGENANPYFSFVSMACTTSSAGRPFTISADAGSSLMMPCTLPASRSRNISEASWKVFSSTPLGARFSSAQILPVVPFCTPTTSPSPSWSVVVMSGVSWVLTVSDCREL